MLVDCQKITSIDYAWWNQILNNEQTNLKKVENTMNENKKVKCKQVSSKTKNKLMGGRKTKIIWESNLELSL